MPKLLQQAVLLGRALRALLGWPDYAAYLERHSRTRAGKPPMDRASFVRLAQERRYSGLSARRCC
jgi:uncharacterized short protein YbdD (DUF466 family)